MKDISQKPAERIGKSMEREVRQKIQDVEELLVIHNRSLNYLKKQAAMYATVPPEIALPIEQKQEEIAKLEDQLSHLQEKLSHLEQKDFSVDFAKAYAGDLAQKAQGKSVSSEENKEMSDESRREYLQKLAQKAK